jgi:hypothetical protein
LWVGDGVEARGFEALDGCWYSGLRLGESSTNYT